MGIIEMARDLGAKLQEEEAYKNYQEAKSNLELDSSLQTMIGEFNLKKISINSEMGKNDKDDEKLKLLNDQIKELYDKIMENEKMQIFNSAKNEIDSLVSHINAILMMSANGEDPATAGESSCGGSCSGCTGCG